MFIEELFEELSELKQVEAIALGGSRATGKGDEKSDYDVYVREQCKILPKHFGENLEKLFLEMFQGDVCRVIAEMVGEIREILNIPANLK